MKKLLSITLAVAMIMSLFCVVPASATMIGSAGIYVFEDFEDGTSTVTCSASNGSLEVVDTDNGSAKALQYTFSNDVSYPDLGVIGSFDLKTGFTEDMTLRGTVRYKLGTELSKGVLSLITVNSGDGNFYSIWKIPNLTDTTNWYTAEFEIPNFAADADSLMFNLRVGNSGEKATQSASGEDVVIYFDDLQISREKNTNKEVVNFSSTEATSYLTINAGSKSVVDDPLNNDNKVLKLTPSSNGGLYNYLYFQYKDSEVTYNVGDYITFSCDVLVEGIPSTNTSNLQFRIYPRDCADTTTKIAVDETNYFARPYSVAAAGTWQTITCTFEVGALGSGQYMPYFYLTDNTDNISADDDGKKDMGYYTFYFDNMTVTVSDRSAYTVPTATDLTATMAEDGTVTPSYTYAETAVSGVEAGTNVSLLKVKRANGAVVASAVAGEALVVPEAYRNESLTLEVLPVSSRGLFGDAVVTAAITAASTEPEIEGITLTQDSGSVTVATETALTNAQLIFVTYDANGKMVDWEAVDVTLAAQGTQAYAPVDLTAGSYTKAMLWQDMTKCVPLADMIQY